jgi:hypothetical protein
LKRGKMDWVVSEDGGAGESVGEALLTCGDCTAGCCANVGQARARAPASNKTFFTYSRDRFMVN